MKRSKIIFLILAGVFFLVMIYIGYDISSRTTFPGSRPQLKERLQGREYPGDTAKRDSIIERQ